MYIHCYRSSAPNFGDDLNGWLWYRHLDTPFPCYDDMVLVGVGTILADRVRKAFPRPRHWATLGAGVGYDDPMQHVGSDNWITALVRGPLSAKVLGISSAHVCTDGAILLSALPEFAPLPESQRSGIVFMPHHHALDIDQWRVACERAGVEFLDPRWDSHALTARLRSAKLVLADAMHSAIVADTMRVPWIPLVSSPQISTFKWLDWTGSLDLQYDPTPLPAISLRAAYMRDKMGWYGERHEVVPAEPDAAVRAVTKKAARRSPLDGYWPRTVRKVAAKTITALQTRAAAKDHSRPMEEAAQMLSELSTRGGFLSDDTLFREKQSQMLDGVAQLNGWFRKRSF